MMYLSKIKSNAKYLMNSIHYYIITNDEEKLLNRIYSTYDNAISTLPNIDDIDSNSIIEIEIFINKALRDIPYFIDLLDSETRFTNFDDKRRVSVNILCEFLKDTYDNNKLLEFYSDGTYKITTELSRFQRNYEEEKIKKSLHKYLYAIKFNEISKSKKIGDSDVSKSKNETKNIGEIFLKKEKETLELLVEHKILNKNYEWRTSCLNRKAKDKEILLVKLASLKIISLKNQSAVAEYFTDFFKSKISKSNLSTIQGLYITNDLSNTEKETISQLDFLNKLSD